MKLLVTGGRDFADWDQLERVLTAVHAQLPISRLIHGDARGADHLAGCWARDNGVEVKPCPADWSKGLGAGPDRNQQMLDEEQPDVVLAFAGGAGTADMVRRARAAGVRVVVVPRATPRVPPRRA